MACIIYYGFNDLKTIFFPNLLHGLHISRYLRRIFYTKICGLLRKSACSFRQVETKMYLPESHFFKNSLAGASRLVLMSDPETNIYLLSNISPLLDFLGKGHSIVKIDI